MRHGSRALTQQVGLAAQRFTAQPHPLALGQIVSFDPATHMAVAKVDYGDGFVFNTPPSQLMVPWHGPGYSDASGPEEGQQCIVGTLDAAGDVFVILGFTATEDANGINVPAGEKKFSINTDRSSTTAARAAACAPSATHLRRSSAERQPKSGREPRRDQRCDNSEVGSRRRARRAARPTQSDLATWAATKLQPGSGATAPVTLTAVRSTGSSKSRAVP
jgi:hypothetical protein